MIKRLLKYNCLLVAGGRVSASAAPAAGAPSAHSSARVRVQVLLQALQAQGPLQDTPQHTHRHQVLLLSRLREG